MKWTLETEHKLSSFQSTYGNTLDLLIQNHENVMVLEADLMKSSGTSELFQKYPNNCVNFGISESNMISAAGGMSKAGLIPYAHSFGPFITRRTLDQIYMSIAYSNSNLHIYASDTGIWSQRNGGTHTTNEDIAIMNSIPNCKVFDPSDPVQFKWILESYHKEKGLYYTRAGRKNEIQHIYAEGSKFEIGKGCTLRKGNSKIAVIATGLMVHEALLAYDSLMKKGIQITVIDLFSIKPYDKELLQSTIQSNNLIIAAENHTYIGGIGSIVAYEIAQSSSNPKFRHLAIPDAFGEVGSLEYLKDKFKLNALDIEEIVLTKHKVK